MPQGTATEKPSAYLTDPTGREHTLSTERTVIGRAVECDVIITSRRVSREHACILREGWRVMLEDLGSTNGTFLNNERILKAAQLRDQDQIKIGDVTFTFHDPDITFQENVFPELEIDVSAGVVRLDRSPVKLSPKEFAILVYLDSRSGEVCSKDDIAAAVWPEYQAGVYDYQVENLIRRVREKLEPDASNPVMLLTMRGLGYKLIGNH